MTSTYEWRKAVASANNGGCFEMRETEDGFIAVRDSKDPDGPQLRFTKFELACMFDGVRNGEFNDFAE